MADSRRSFLGKILAAGAVIASKPMNNLAAKPESEKDVALKRALANDNPTVADIIIIRAYFLEMRASGFKDKKQLAVFEEWAVRCGGGVFEDTKSPLYHRFKKAHKSLRAIGD